MAGLEPPKDQELFQAFVVDGFDADELARAGAVFSREDFNIKIFWQQALQGVLQTILTLLHNYGPPSIILMVRGAILIKPACPRLRKFCEQYYPDGLLPLPADLAGRIGNFGLVQDVNLGLQALIDKSKDLTFRDTLVTFRTRFSDTSRQIRVLKKYKGLHNALHLLQGQLVGIEAVVAQVRTGGASARNLRTLAFNLKPISVAARADVESLPHPERETEWIDEFDALINELSRIATIAAPSGTDLDKVADVPIGLRALLRQQAPRINLLLVNAADNLPLEGFAETMNEIAQSAASTSGNDPVLQKLATSAAAVTGLRGSFKALLDQHSCWQDLNTPLDEAEVSEKYQPAARIPQWDRFKKRFDALCARYPGEPWSQELQKSMADWIAATSKAEPDDAEKIAGDIAFDDLRHACLDRFITVDSELVDLSDKVTVIAAPLDELLSKIP